MLCGIGLWVDVSISSEDKQSTANSTDDVAPIERPSPSEANSNQKTSLPTDLEILDTYQDDYTKSVVLRALLSSADRQRVISLLEQSKDIRPEEQRLTIQVEILRRFAVIEPLEAMKHTFDIAWNRRAPIVKAIFLEWATSDVDAAIQHAKTLGSSDRRIALKAILRMQDDWSEDRIMELALEFGHESIGTEILEQIQIARAFNDPRAAWNAILEDTQRDGSQVNALRTTLQLWVAREGLDVIFEAIESVSESDHPRWVLEPIIKPIAQDDPRQAFELINEFSESARNAAAFTVVDVWAHTDPAAALDTVSKLDFHPMNVKDNLMRNISFAWAESAPYEAFEHLPKYLPSHYLQTMRGDAIQKIVRLSPQDAVELLKEMPDGVEELGRDLVEEWASVDARSALHWIGSQEESLRPMLLQSVIPALVEEDPDLALNTALSQEIAVGQMGLEYEVIKILARTDVHRAIEMLPQVREHDDTKKRAYSELGSALVRHNESSTAIELGSDLSEVYRDSYYRAVINTIYNKDQVELYEILDLLPERKYQQEAARYIIWESGFGGYSHRYFTEEQLEEVRAFE